MLHLMLIRKIYCSCSFAATSFPGSLSYLSRDPGWVWSHVSQISGRLQTNDLGEGRISVRFVSTKHRRRDQWKLHNRPCLKGPVFYSFRTSQDKTSNAESFDSESVTSCRISGCLSDVAKEITDSPLVQSKIF